MSRLDVLYTQLIRNRRADVDGWIKVYRAFTAAVEQVRAALMAGGQLREPATYHGTEWASKPDPWNAFAHALIRTGNGVTGTGQSVLSVVDLDAFLSDPGYVAALEALIRAPSEAHFKAFASAWEKLRRQRDIKRNPLLINRVAAACTLTVSSTVNEADFDRLYQWLIQEDLLREHPSKVGWYARNEYLMTYLQREFSDMLASGDTDLHTLSAFVWQIRANLASPFDLKKQIVRYGAPGTGKTFTAWRDTRVQFDIWKSLFGTNTLFTHEECCLTVQFHPSYGYEDFMEGLRPVLSAEGKSQLVLQNGVFKRLCIAAGQWEMDVYRIETHGPELCRAWRTLTIEALLPYRDALTDPRWETILVDDNRDRLVTDAIPPFFLIIDEINRAELSRVLGELMICLEYRGPNHAILTQYAAINDRKTGMLRVDDMYRFFVPHNVYIIGTMNTIDRSIESFDLALRRRFSWQRVDPDIKLLRHHLRQHGRSEYVGLADRLASLNEAIRKHELLGPDYQIGHAYLMNLPYSSELKEAAVGRRVWQDSLGPLLEEYLRGSDAVEDQLGKFRSAFGLT